MSHIMEGHRVPDNGETPRPRYWRHTVSQIMEGHCVLDAGGQCVPDAEDVSEAGGRLCSGCLRDTVSRNLGLLKFLAVVYLNLYLFF